MGPLRPDLLPRRDAPPRVVAACWLGALALHLPLLALRPGRQPPTPAAVAAKPVELKLATEEEVKALMNPETEAASAPRRAGDPSAARAGSKSIWERLEDSGFAMKNSVFARKAPTPAGAALKTAPAADAVVADAWKPQARPAPKLAQAAFDADDDIAETPAKPSPWNASAGLKRGGGPALRDSTGDATELSQATGAGIADPSWDAGGAGDRPSPGMKLGSGGGAGGYGFDLKGPLRKRRIESAPTPPYPDWAKEQGLECDVQVYFIVRREGAVRDGVVVRKTSGDPRLDQLVVRTVRTWKFAPLAGAQEVEQWGLVTFHFRLHG